MEQDHEEHTETTPSVSRGAALSPRARQLANLRPPWRPGQSGNPSGLTKDGRVPGPAKLQDALQSELKKSGGMEALAKRWVALAKRGNGTALMEILKRLYPTEEATNAPQVIEGLKLEVSEGTASVTLLRAAQGSTAAPLELRGSEEVGVPESVSDSLRISSDGLEISEGGGGSGTPATPTPSGGVVEGGGGNG